VYLCALNTKGYYDAAGNRTVCAVINLSPALSPPVPPPPPDSTAEKPGSVETQCIASLQLYNPSGQLLQEHPVHSATTVVSLAGIAKGVYILKVSVNGVVDNWKIIKQ